MVKLFIASNASVVTDAKTGRFPARRKPPGLLVGGLAPKPLPTRISSAATHRSGAVFPHAPALGLSLFLFVQIQVALQIDLIDQQISALFFYPCPLNFFVFFIRPAGPQPA